MGKFGSAERQERQELLASMKEMSNDKHVDNGEFFVILHVRLKARLH